MFARLFAVASLAALAVAGPAPLVLRQECSTGAINCCNSVYPAETVQQSLSQFGLADIFANLEGTLVGTGCSSSGVVGVGATGATCAQKPVCCNNNVFNGIAVGCSPIGADL